MKMAIVDQGFLVNGNRVCKLLISEIPKASIPSEVEFVLSVPLSGESATLCFCLRYAHITLTEEDTFFNEGERLSRLLEGEVVEVSDSELELVKAFVRRFATYD